MKIKDRRVRRTYRLLSEALLRLIRKKGYENISIKDITDEADVAYVTFFRHFDDIDELLLHTLDALVDEVIGLIKASITDVTDIHTCLQIEGRTIFEHAAANRTLYETLLNDEISLKTYRAIQKRIGYAIIADSRDALLNMGMTDDDFPMPVHLLTYHSAGAILTLLDWWFSADMPLSPAQMAEYFAKLVSMPVDSLAAETTGVTPGELLKAR